MTMGLAFLLALFSSEPLLSGSGLFLFIASEQIIEGIIKATRPGRGCKYSYQILKPL